MFASVVLFDFGLDLLLVETFHIALHHCVDGLELGCVLRDILFRLLRVRRCDVFQRDLATY